MELTLHKLSEGFIITSYEGFKVGELCFDTTENEVYPSKGNLPANEYVLRVIAQQDQIDFSDLKEEEQKEIGWFDEIKIAYDLLIAHPDFKAEGMSEYQNGRFNGIVEGFQKMQEFLSDRKFTLEDARKIWNSAYIDALALDEENYKPLFFEDFIQSLSQPKSWKIEVEMEDLFRANEETYIDDCGAKGNYSTHSKKPKLTNGKIKITKIHDSINT